MRFENNSDLTISKLAAQIRRRRLSPLELTRFMLARITKLQPAINAYLTVTAELALTQARQAEKEIAGGRYKGWLHGIPVCLKDIFYTRGIRTTAGSKILNKFVPKENAAAVDRLLEAGCILLGKTNLHEFAYGATNVNPHYGPVHNPWDSSRISGGSSGGSAAAVVSAQAIASLGSDTGGSVRIPAAACGCVGLKPTYGRVPLHGVIPLASTLDHGGVLCRCVEDAAHVLAVISEPDQHDSGSSKASNRALKSGVKGLQIGLPRQFFFDAIQLVVRQKVLAAIGVLEQLGAEICEVDMKRMKETTRLAADITAAEALAYHSKWLERRAESYGADVRAHLEEGKSIPALVYLQAQQLRRRYTEELEACLESVNVLAAPTLPVVAPGIEENEVRTGRSAENVRPALLRLTRPGNLTGLPAISVPCGFSKDGLPVGLQLIGRRFDEATVLRVAYAYERATPWHKQFPPETEDHA